MKSILDNLTQIRGLIREVVDALDDDSLEDSVEVGTVLASVVRIANESLTGIKSTLRTAALTNLRGQPGVETFQGQGNLTVTVAVPAPSLRILKSVDTERLKRVLGDDFDKFFETRVTYKPRPDLGERIMDLPAGDTKNTLLLALEEVDNTPRVSFPKR